MEAFTEVPIRLLDFLDNREAKVSVQVLSY